MDQQEETNRQAGREESEAAILLSMHDRSPWSLLRISCSVRTWAHSDTFQELMLQRCLSELQKCSFVCNCLTFTWNKNQIMLAIWVREPHVCLLYATLQFVSKGKEKEVNLCSVRQSVKAYFWSRVGAGNSVMLNNGATWCRNEEADLKASVTTDCKEKVTERNNITLHTKLELSW